MKAYNVIRNPEPGSAFLATKEVDGADALPPAPWERISEAEFEASRPAKVRSAPQRPFWRALRQLHPTITRTGVRVLLPTLPGLSSDAGALEDALVDFDTAETVEITNPLIPLVQSVYGLTDAQVISVFDLADTFV